MKNKFPRIYVSAEIRHKMVEIAREFRKQTTRGEKILYIRQNIPSPFLGEGRGGG